MEWTKEPWKPRAAAAKAAMNQATKKEARTAGTLTYACAEYMKEAEAAAKAKAKHDAAVALAKNPLDDAASARSRGTRAWRRVTAPPRSALVR